MTYILALDQGTTSSRSIVFDREGSVVSAGQKEYRQIYPQSGWVEHDPHEIWRSQIETALESITKVNLTVADIVAVGITNQRETTLLWDRHTGEPVHNAIVWQDTRTDRIVRELAGDVGPDRFRDICGTPLATYFSAPKIRWLLDRDPDLRRRAENGDVL